MYVQSMIGPKGAEVKRLHEFSEPLLYGHKAVFRADRFIKLTCGMHSYFT
ncbi:MAG TPA: hypothetical protein VJP58_04035 [Candidatus Nitrosocosmicus sp.]|nr:hypothetical protein [Candidatus Nitrosocosmicus sp.]